MQNSADPEAGSESTTAFSETYKEILWILERYFEFAQSTQQAFIRLLLTLSSGSLVASISLLRFTVNAETAWLALLPISWGFLGISVIVCLLHVGSTRNYLLTFVTLRFFADPTESTKESGWAARLSATETILDRLKQFSDDSDLKWDRRQSVIALTSFSLGLLTLLVFATKNLPWSL